MSNIGINLLGKKKRTISIFLLSFCLMFLCFNPLLVKAETTNSATMHEPLSQGQYGDYELVWEFEENCSCDILRSVKIGNEIIAEYTYDDFFHRDSKVVNGVYTYFSYSEDGLLTSVTENDTILNYFYGYDIEQQKNNVMGFEYNGERYYFIYDNVLISGIELDNEEIVKYNYSETGEFISTLALKNGEWVECNDEYFIGNINKVRFTQSYYDEETDWYYMHRYYDAQGTRYVDGILFDEALKLIENCECEDIGDILARVYSLGIYKANSVSSKARTVPTTEEQIDVVARVIYAEAGSESADWLGVSWVIYNRIQHDGFAGNTAYDIVTADGQFKAYTDKSDLYKNPTTTEAKWHSAVANATQLVKGSTPVVSINYVKTQVYFKKVTTFIDNYSSDGTTQTYNGKVIIDVAIPHYCTISASETHDDLYNKYYDSLLYKYNIYYTEQ